MSYVAAFRAYRWNDGLAILAARFFAACPGARHVVLMNEENGSVAVNRFEKIAHGSDFTSLGLPDRPAGRSLWFNGDYAYGHLRRALPDYEHYVIVESDVSVNLSLEPMMRTVAVGGIDALVHGLQPCRPNWRWYEASLSQPDPHVAALSAIVLSGRALDLMLPQRQALARRLGDDPATGWPIVESFVPTTIRNAGLRIGEIGDHAATDHLRVSPALSLGDPDAHTPGTIAHPVLCAGDLAARLLGEHPPEDFHRPGSALQLGLGGETLASVAPALWSAFLHRADHHGLARLSAEMQTEGIAVPHYDDLAWGKPATISSIGPWSRCRDARREASGANGLAEHDNCAFHTDVEQDAWWMVDLLAACAVGRVEIVNRVDFADRFRCFALDSSDNGVDWTVCFSKDDASPVSGDASHPFEVRFAEPLRCRFLRVRRLGPPGFLHLRRVRVFGPGSMPGAPPTTRPSAALLSGASHG